MGKIWMPGGGGSAELDKITAKAEDVLTPKVIVDQDGNPLTGTMPDNTGTALTVSTNGKTLIPKGYHDGTQYATNTQATMAGGTKTPTTSAQTISCNGKLMTSNIVIPAFSLPSASIIKKGAKYTLYGKTVTGTWEGYATSPLYLYKNGTWSNLQTSGISKVGGYDLDVGDTQLKIWASANSDSYDYTCGRLNSSIDLTNYNYVKVYVSKTENNSKYDTIIIGVDTSATLSYASHCDVYYTDSHPYASYVILDVSSLTGNHYIYINYNYLGAGDYGTTYAYITQIFLSAT